MAFKLKDKGVHQCLKLVALLLSVHGMGVGVGNAWAVKSAAEIEQEAQNQVDAENAAKAPTVPRSPYQQVPVLQPVDDHDPDKLASEEDFRKAKKDQINANSALEGHKAESAQTLREMDASKNPLNAQLHELSNVQRLSPLPGVKVPPAGLIKKHEEALEDKKKELSRLKADYKTTHPGNYARAFGKGLKRLLPAKMDPKLAHIRGLQDAIDQETKQIKAEKQQLENKKNEITKELKKIDSEIKAYSKLSASKQKELDKAHHDAIRAAAARRHQYDLDVADAAQGGTSRFAKRGSAQDAATVPSRGAPVATTVDRDRGGLSGYPVLGTSSSSPPVAISRSAQGASSGDIIARLKELHTNPHVSVGGDPQITRVKFDVLVVMAGNGFIYNDPTASAMQDYAKLAVQAEYALRDLYQEKLRNANNDEAVAKVALKSDPKAKVLTEVVRSSLASFPNPQANASLQQEVHAARDFLEKNKIKLPSVDLKKHNPSVASSCALVQESSPATPVVSSTAGSVANIAAYVAEHKRTTDAKLAQLTDQNEVLMQQNAALQRQLTAMRQSIRQNPEGVDRTNPGLGSLYGGVPREVAAYTPESSWVASSRRPGTQNLTSASSSRGAAASPSGGQYLDGASARQVTGTPESSVVENPQNLLYSRGLSGGYSPLLAASGNDSGSGLGGGAGGGSRELIAQEVQLPPALPPPPPTVHSLQGGVVLTEDEVLDENELNPNAHNSITAASPLAVPAPPLSETVRSQHMGPPSTIFPQYVGGSNSQTTPSLQSNQLRTGSGNPTAGGY